MQLHELRTVTANSLCSSLQVESLDIRYVSGMKEADSLFQSLSLSLAGTTRGGILPQVLKESQIARRTAGAVPGQGWSPACVGCSSQGACMSRWLGWMTGWRCAGLEWVQEPCMLQAGARLMPQTLGALASPCPFLASYNSQGCKTDPKVQV